MPEQTPLQVKAEASKQVQSFPLFVLLNFVFP